MDSQSEPSLDNPLFAALDAAHVAYAKRRSSRGVDYAGLRWARGGSGGDVALTAILERGVLRLTVHELSVPPDPLAVFNSAARLPIGNVYLSPDDGQVEISLGLYVNKAAALDRCLPVLMNYLYDACQCLELGQAAPRLPALPAAHPAAAAPGGATAAVLASYGHTAQPLPDGAAVVLKLSEAQSCCVDVRAIADGWYGAHARYQPSARIGLGEGELALLHRLQRWASAGRFALTESAELGAEVLTPSLGQPPKELIAWTVSQSTAMLQVAAQHFHLGAHASGG